MPAIVALLADDVFGGEREAAPDDVDETTERARFRLFTECVDDQGATFRLWQPTD
jgi:hypothetical protein